MKQDRFKLVQHYIETSQSFVVTGIPGMGISLFLQSLAEHDLGYFVYVDVFSVSEYSAEELLRSLSIQLGYTPNDDENIHDLCRKRLVELCSQHNRVLICFAGFDQLGKQVNKKLLSQLKSLRNINQEKIIFIFGVCKQMKHLVTDDLLDSDIRLLSSVMYLKPYNPTEVLALLERYGPRISQTDEQFDEVVRLSGGHFQLLQLLLRSERPQNTQEDPFIQLVLKNIYEQLDYRQKKLLQTVLMKNHSVIRDHYLEEVGIIEKNEEGWKFFSPLFKDYVLTSIKTKLPKKESELFGILKERVGKIVDRNELFEVIWKDEPEKASDWALDALIYRLRKHPAFTYMGYGIENYKKQGYLLVEK